MDPSTNSIEFLNCTITNGLLPIMEQIEFELKQEALFRDTTQESNQAFNQSLSDQVSNQSLSDEEPKQRDKDQEPNLEDLDLDEDELLSKIDQTMICPITKLILCDPVVASDGHIYEKTAIRDWLNNNNTSPLTREIMTPNLNKVLYLKNQINEYLEKHPLYRQYQYTKHVKTIKQLYELSNTDRLNEFMSYNTYDIKSILLQPWKTILRYFTKKEYFKKLFDLSILDLSLFDFKIENYNIFKRIVSNENVDQSLVNYMVDKLIDNPNIFRFGMYLFEFNKHTEYSYTKISKKYTDGTLYYNTKSMSSLIDTISYMKYNLLMKDYILCQLNKHQYNYMSKVKKTGCNILHALTSDYLCMDPDILNKLSSLCLVSSMLFEKDNLNNTPLHNIINVLDQFCLEYNVANALDSSVLFDNMLYYLRYFIDATSGCILYEKISKENVIDHIIKTIGNVKWASLDINYIKYKTLIEYILNKYIITELDYEYVSNIKELSLFKFILSKIPDLDLHKIDTEYRIKYYQLNYLLSTKEIIDYVKTITEIDPTDKIDISRIAIKYISLDTLLMNNSYIP